MGFISYTGDVVDLMDRHHVRSHIYADDTQYYDSCRLNKIDSLRSRLSCCATDINHLCRSRRLQLNASKTEAIWFGSKSNLMKLGTANISIEVGSATIQPSAVVRDLGLHLDSELSMKQHVAKVAAVCFYHLRRLRHDTSTRWRGSDNPASSGCSDI